MSSQISYWNDSEQIHRVFSPICCTNFFHEFFSICTAVEKENLIGPKHFFLSLPAQKEIISNMRRFRIRDW